MAAASLLVGTLKFDYGLLILQARSEGPDPDVDDRVFQRS